MEYLPVNVKRLEETFEAGDVVNGESLKAKYLAFDIVAGLLPLTFIPLGWAPWDVLVMVSGLVSLLVLLGLLVFARRQLFSEFGKQFSA